MLILATTLLILALTVFAAGLVLDVLQAFHVPVFGTATRAAGLLTLASIAAVLIAQQ